MAIKSTKPAPVVPVSFPKGKTGVAITEQDGSVLIEFDKISIFVKPK